MYKQIRKKRYTSLIVAITQTAVPLFPLLLTRYKEKFIYDYRDITYENIPLYRRIVNKLVKNSCFTAVSSKGFVESGFLDKSDKITISHNTTVFEQTPIKRTCSDAIRIVYWGMVRQVKFNKKICDLFGKDERFTLVYHGAGFHKELDDYCKQKGYSISFTGPYKRNEIGSFVANTDFMLNAYENDKQQKPAMTVKFYDSLIDVVPMIVSADSYMANICEQNSLGIPFDFENAKNLDELYKKIKNFDEDIFRKNSKEILEQVKKEDKFFEKKLIDFTKDK